MHGRANPKPGAGATRPFRRVQPILALIVPALLLAIAAMGLVACGSGDSQEDSSFEAVVLPSQNDFDTGYYAVLINADNIYMDAGLEEAWIHIKGSGARAGSPSEGYVWAVIGPQGGTGNFDNPGNGTLRIAMPLYEADPKTVIHLADCPDCEAGPGEVLVDYRRPDGVAATGVSGTIDASGEYWDGLLTLDVFFSGLTLEFPLAGALRRPSAVIEPLDSAKLAGTVNGDGRTLFNADLTGGTDGGGGNTGAGPVGSWISSGGQNVATFYSGGSGEIAATATDGVSVCTSYFNWTATNSTSGTMQFTHILCTSPGVDPLDQPLNDTSTYSISGDSITIAGQTYTRQ